MRASERAYSAVCSDRFQKCAACCASSGSVRRALRLRVRPRIRFMLCVLPSLFSACSKVCTGASRCRAALLAAAISTAVTCGSLRTSSSSTLRSSPCGFSARLIATCTSANSGPPSAVARRCSRKAGRLAPGCNGGTGQAICSPTSSSSSSRRLRRLSMFSGLLR
ncbi:hypothetical protein D3C81_1691890 [compost metagenome]